MTPRYIAELEEYKRHTEDVMADAGKLNDLLGVYDLCQVVTRSDV